MSDCQRTDITGSMHIRSPLARAVHQKLIEDNAVQDMTEVSVTGRETNRWSLFTDELFIIVD